MTAWRSIDQILLSDRVFEYGKVEIDFIQFRIGVALSIIGFTIFAALKSEKIELIARDGCDVLIALSILLSMNSISFDAALIHNYHFIMWNNLDASSLKIFPVMSSVSELSIVLSISLVVVAVGARLYEEGKSDA